MNFAYPIGNIPAEHHLSSLFSLRGPIQNQAKSPIDHFTPKKKQNQQKCKNSNQKNANQSPKTLWICSAALEEEGWEYCRNGAE